MYSKHLLFISMFLLVVLCCGTSLGWSETHTGDKQILDAAQDYIAANSAPGIKYKLRVAKEVDNWAVVDIIPLRKDLDPALVILEKVQGKWTGRELTSDTSVLEEYPELSK